MVLTNIIFLWHLHAVINTKGKNFKLTPVVLIRHNTIDTIHQELSTKPYFIIIVVVVIIIIITTILLLLLLLLLLLFLSLLLSLL